MIGASRAPSEGAIACVTIDGTPRLVAVQGEIVSDGGELPEALVAAASGPEAAVPTGLADAVARQLERWLRRVEVGSVVNLSAIRLTRSRRATLQRVEGISRRTPRHARPRVAPLVEAARAAATATLSAGAERVLSELSSAPMADDAWLQAVGQFAELHARPRGGPPRIDAILLLVADR